MYLHYSLLSIFVFIVWGRVPHCIQSDTSAQGTHRPLNGFIYDTQHHLYNSWIFDLCKSQSMKTWQCGLMCSTWWPVCCFSKAHCEFLYWSRKPATICFQSFPLQCEKRRSVNLVKLFYNTKKLFVCFFRLFFRNSNFPFCLYSGFDSLILSFINEDILQKLPILAGCLL